MIRTAYLDLYSGTSENENMKKLYGQLIALTKNIWLLEPKNEHGYITEFFVGKKNPFVFTGGIGISWWYTKKSFKIVENISFIIAKDYEEFSGCDHESIGNLVKKTLMEICVDNRIFNGDDVCFGRITRKETLFSCKKCIDTDLFASIIAEELFLKIRENNTDWCIVYAVPRLSGESFCITSEDLTVLKKTDKTAWSQLVTKGYSTDNWCPISGMYFQENTTPFSNYKYDYIFVSEQSGTNEGSMFATSLKFKKLFSVIFSIIGEKFDYQLHKCGAEPYPMCLQFPSKSSNLGIYMSQIGKLLPYYLEDHFLNSDDIEKIKEWYELELQLDCEFRNRIEKSAHFINHAMNSKDIESYVNYFISLDALFGKRGSVEASISDGVNRLPSCNKWKDKIPWLFELRNELVHGGSRYIKEWSRYYNYYRHFGSEPDSDLKNLAFTSLYHAPNLFK